MKRVSVAIILKEGKVLVCQRKRGVRYELKWEFPGGKVEPGESAEQAVKRELWEELSIRIHGIDHIEIQSATYDDGKTYEVAYCTVPGFEGEVTNNVFEEVRWVTMEELQSLDVLEGNRDIVRQMKF